ncbi:MAG TPA: type IV secretion system protein [Steroidobacteraceae bacterium]|nr:type IV secretion system protein [Steroidobacteraceae bacterium]
MTAEPALHGYFEEAASWDRDRAAHARRDARTAWRVAAAGWICALASAGALISLMPLKRVVPFLIRVDKSTGIVDVVPIYAGRATQPEAVTRYFLSHYVSVCERFNFATAESDYEECAAFQAPRLQQAWYARWNQANPSSPLNLHKDGSSVRVQIEAVSFFTRASGLSDLAQVRYLKFTRRAAGGAEAAAHFIATMQYAYTAPAADPRTRGANPLGFKIVDFRTEPEVTEDARDARAAPAAAPTRSAP